MLLALCASDPNIESEGYVAEAEAREQLIPGVHRTLDVQQLLGSPSSINHFGGQQWYYIHTQRETTAFFKPELTEQKAFRVRFDENGTLEGIDDFSKEDGVPVQFVQKETPTEGHSLGFFEQILGNVGRFNAQPGQP